MESSNGFSESSKEYQKSEKSVVEDIYSKDEDIVIHRAKEKSRDFVSPRRMS